MSDEYSSEYNRFQSSPQKTPSVDVYEEEFEKDYEEAYDNADSLKASSVTMNYSISKTGNFEEHIDLPPPKYEKVIEEQFEENDESKYNQPTQEELDMQNKRIKKAQEALIKMKKEEIAKKRKPGQKLLTVEKPKKYQQKEKSATNLKRVEKTESKKQEKKGSGQLFVKDESKSVGTFAFREEKPVKGTNEAPPAFAKPSLPPLKIPVPSPQEAKEKKKEEERKAAEGHKANLENLRSVIDEKKIKAEQDVKKMQEMQKKLLQNERNYKPPDRVPDRTKKIPPPPPAPKPRALTQNAYKLHQLASSTGNPDQRLTAEKLSGAMLQAIKLLSSKTSEELTYNEILEEEKRLIESERILISGKDMKRGETDYHEESRKKIKIFQSLIDEHKNLVQSKVNQIKVQETLLEKVKKLEGIKAVVKLGDGKYMRAGMMPDDLIDTLSELESVGSEVMKENPIDQLIEKIEKQGCSLKDLFTQIDFDGDKILTITEIRNGLASIQIKLTEDDKALLLKTLDSNSDGVVSEEEFYKILDPKLQVQKEYRAIIGTSDINNPIIFEEQILDMKLRGKMLNKETPKLANNLKTKVEAEQKLLNRIKLLENILQSRQITTVSAGGIKRELEQQLSEAMAKKDQVFQIGMQEKSTHSMKFSALQEKIQTVNREKANTVAELEFKKREFSSSQARKEAILSKEDKLDKANRMIAIVIIQTKIRRYLARMRYLKEKKRVEGALNVIVPAMKKYTQNKKERKALEEERKQIEVNIDECEQMSHHSIKSVNSEHSQDQDYLCGKCKKSADRICLQCQDSFCNKCFAACRIKNHTFAILASTRKVLNSAEKEFVLILVKEFNAKGIVLRDLFKENTKLSFNSMKGILIDARPIIERYLVQNLLTLSEKSMDENGFVDVNELFVNYFV